MSSQSAEKHIKERTLLVVEDDMGIGALLLEVISQETSFRARLVTDGFQALNVIKDIKPDLLILDYQLPLMNGIELYDRLHSLVGLENVPTIMMSARLPKREIEKRSIMGLNKPFEINDLLKMIATVLP
jgi:DNA-binding response OmpR family regulator